MKLMPMLTAIGSLVGAAEASACLPPLPDDPPPPSLEERVKGAFEHSTDIVYGVVTGYKKNSGRSIRFRVIHSYKGALAPGARLELEPGYGLDPPPCIGISGMPPVPKGASGVILFNRNFPRLDFVSREELEMMFERGWIRRASR